MAKQPRKSKPQKTISDARSATNNAAEQEDALKKFEQRHDLFMNEFRATCEKAGVPVAIAVVVDPENPKLPLVYARGHLYDQGTLLAQMLKNVRQQIDKDMGI
jgi:hypothetical protein